MDLPEFQMKHLLQEEVEIILKKELSFTVDCCVRSCHVFKSFWEAPVGSILTSKHKVDPQMLIHD